MVASLHASVTSAIWRAEQLAEIQDSSALLAWAEVSLIEEELASALPVSLPEGRIARRGAVRAALKAQEPIRAHGLAQRYLAAEDAPESLRAEIGEILDADTHT